MKSAFSRLTIASILTLLLSISAFAFDKQTEQRLHKDLDAIEKLHNEDKQYGIILEKYPLALKKEIAKEYGITVNEIDKMLKKRIESEMDAIEYLNTVKTLKIRPYKIFPLQTTSKTRNYARIFGIMEEYDSSLPVPDIDQKMIWIFAVEEGGKWYYYIYDSKDDSKVKPIIEKAYPDIIDY